MAAKKGEELKQLRALVREQGQITGFSYAFSRLLLLKLKELLALGRVFEAGWEKATEEEKENRSSKLTPIATSIIEHLVSQMEEKGKIFGSVVDPNSPKEISLFISTAEEFLSIFEEVA